MTHAINKINLGPRARRVVRFAARFVNPVILLIAGRRWMPVVGILHHRGRRSGRDYATPIGMRPLGDSFVIPRTFSENAAWYLNVKAAGWCVVTYLGSNHVLIEPEVVDFAMAAPAFPRYELWQFRLIGINEYLRLRRAPEGWSPTAAFPSSHRGEGQGDQLNTAISHALSHSALATRP